jgi:membrane-bound metal-dependent hydrolase YbcI (DUF457 family)
MGVAVAIPVAATLPFVGATGCVWLGAIGGGFPDFLDLRSGARHFLKHRGVSHSLFVLAGLTFIVWYLLSAVARADYPPLPVPDRYVLPWTLSLALGNLSHLAGDACTRRGIQPLLPLSAGRWWLLPKLVRGRSDGKVNILATILSCTIIVIGLVAYYYAWSGS